MLLDQARPQADGSGQRVILGVGEQLLMQMGETGTVHETAIAAVMQGILDQLQQFAAVRMALQVLKVPHQRIHQPGVDGEVFADSQPVCS